jgi:dTMP kinase
VLIDANADIKVIANNIWGVLRRRLLTPTKNETAPA